MTLPNIYPVPCIKDRLRPDAKLCVAVPGSKSITNRALLLGTLADGTTILRGALFSDDSRHFLKCVQDLGFEADADESAHTVTVKGLGGKVPCREASLYVGSAGTAARFLTAYLGLSEGTFHMDASAQMRRRPMKALLDVLTDLGCEVLFEGEPGCFPFTLKAHGFHKSFAAVDINSSSQFLSALLISSCLSKEDFTIRVLGTHGMAYIDMTCRMMEQFGVKSAPPASPADQDTRSYVTKAGQSYQPMDYRVEPDVSAASYFYAMCPLLGIPVRVEHVHFDSLQGDTQFIHILERLGCEAKDEPEGILLLPGKNPGFPGITVDMGACSDQAITLAALAPFADSPTTITGIGHIRLQESDRLSAIEKELTGMGIRCETTNDSITIYPGTPSPYTVETYDDHRMAMGFSLIGLRAPGIQINNPACCRKTFEEYFDVLESIAKTLVL